MFCEADSQCDRLRGNHYSWSDALVSFQDRQNPASDHMTAMCCVDCRVEQTSVDLSICLHAV